MSKNLDIYFSVEDGIDTDRNWNLLYEDPQPLYKDISSSMIKENEGSFLKCPAFQKVTRNTFVIRNPIRSHFSITNEGVFPMNDSYVSFTISNEPSLENNLLIRYGLYFYFFCDESVDVTFTSPYFHKSDYLQKGSIVPGSFDIGQWFRPFHPEINVWEDVDEIIIEKDEPLAYVSFMTDKNVRLKRFTMNNTLDRIAKTCGTSPGWEPFVPIVSRYKRFVSSRTDKIVLREIRNNLI